MKILVTGGAGYIGSHTVLALVNAGFTPVIVDNFSNSNKNVIDRLENIAGSEIHCYQADCSDTKALEAILQTEHCEGLIHFAAFKAVGESVEEPLRYYRNNVANFVGVLEAAIAGGVTRVVFSSTAAVYGTPTEIAVNEDSPAQPESPYGWSKRMDEVILQHACEANASLKGMALRYFNVVGSDSSAEIGESSKTKPQNLLPIIVETVAGKRPKLIINGNDYATKDGTCERDYVHVSDLAQAHVAAFQKLTKVKADYTFDTYNISTGSPTSILELIKTFEKVNNVNVPYTLGPRRAGDPAAYYAKAAKAKKELGWQATKTIEDACRDAWRWQQRQKEDTIQS